MDVAAKLVLRQIGGRCRPAVLRCIIGIVVGGLEVVIGSPLPLPRFVTVVASTTFLVVRDPAVTAVTAAITAGALR